MRLAMRLGTSFAMRLRMRRSRAAIGAGVRTAAAGIACAAVGWSDAAVADAAADAAPERARWRIVDAMPGRGETLRAVASAARGGLAVGDEGGVSWWRDGAWSRAQTPAVVDLAFDASGRLWIGTEEGLFAWAADARPIRRTLRDGEASTRVQRLEAEGDALLVATESGAYWSVGGRTFQTLHAGSTDQRVERIAVRRAQPRPAPRETAIDATSVPAPTSVTASRLVEVWTYGGEGLVRTRGLPANAGLRLVDRIVWPLPRPLVEDGAVDLVLDPGRSRLHLVYADAIAVLALEEAQGGWRWLRPVLPPGAHMRRLVFGDEGEVWLATDHGMLVASEPGGRFLRAALPAGTSDCSDVVVSDLARIDARPGATAPRIVAACETMLLARVEAPAGAQPAREPEGEVAAGAAPRAAKGSVKGAVDAAADAAGEGAVQGAVEGAERSVIAVELPPDPPVRAIRDRALARVGLGVERADGLWQGLRRRALWPSLQLRGVYDVDRGRGRSRDQSFVSGDTRELFDRDRDLTRAHQAAFVLDWELGGLAYPDDAVDLSRELRQVTSLRDDVSDEIHQLYFERQRIRARLAQSEALAPGESVELRLRAEELDAGLDAWTGGWISAWRAAGPSVDSIHPGRSADAVD